jgi:hypothetical protein
LRAAQNHEKYGSPPRIFGEGLGVGKLL